MGGYTSTLVSVTTIGVLGLETPREYSLHAARDQDLFLLAPPRVAAVCKKVAPD
jgi:hypothetical protein